MTLTNCARRVRGAVLFATVGLAMLGKTAPAGADAIEFGNTRYRYVAKNGVTIDGTLNVGVFQRVADDGDIWGTGFSGLPGELSKGSGPGGAGSPGLDTHARYLYVYQLLNDGISQQTIGSVGITVKNATSWGAFNALGFFDDQGLVKTGNPLGNDPGAFDSTYNPSETGNVHIGALTTPAVAITSVELAPDGAAPGQASFRAVWSSSGAVRIGQSSSLWLFTSDAPPEAAVFSAQGATSVNGDTIGSQVRQGGGGGGDTGGDTTNPTPEPSTLVLSCLGLSCLGAAWRRAKRSRAEQA